jgi:hypothetical protein
MAFLAVAARNPMVQQMAIDQLSNLRQGNEPYEEEYEEEPEEEYEEAKPKKSKPKQEEEQEGGIRKQFKVSNPMYILATTRKHMYFI